MNEYTKPALERLGKEYTEVIGTKAAAMKELVREALESFIRQDDEFAQAVAQGGSFDECMNAVAKGVGSSISDIEAYRKAVQFYFKGAEVRMVMEIDVCPNRVKEEGSGGGRKILDLADFL